MVRIEEIIHFLQGYQGREISLMEVCGTHTASIFKHGIRSLISPRIRLISGPGCPVCVTPAGYIDAAVELAQKPGYTLLTFGDMLKVPGRGVSLGESRADGSRVEMMYSPQEAVQRALEDRERIFVVAAVGFETTLPAYCALLQEVENKKIDNVRLLTALYRIIPALEWIGEMEPQIDGYICPGHVSAILGSNVYNPLARKFGRPMTVTGFSAEHLLVGIYDLVRQIERGKAEVHNLYPAVVAPEGNRQALAHIERYFRPGLAYWRGLGPVEDSGLVLKEEYSRWDAGPWLEKTKTRPDEDRAPCRCGEVLTGRVNPPDCPLFGTACTPQAPQGPCMVSAEGSCGIWFRYQKV